MRTKREPEGVPNANRATLRGVRLLPARVGRPNPYGVQWHEKVWDEKKQKERRQTKTEFFPTAEARDARAADLRAMKRAGLLRTSNRRESDQWRAFQEATEGVAWQVVVAGWRAYLMQNGMAPSSITVREHFDACLQQAKKLVAANKMSEDTLRQKRHKLGLFCEQFGGSTLATVGKVEVEEWLDGFEFDSGATFNNYLKHVRAAFQTAVEDKLIRENPCSTIVKLDEESDADRKLTVPQAAQLLHTALTYRDASGEPVFRVMLCRLALEFFAGIRFGSATRLIEADVNVVDRGIRHPKRSIKTRRRQYVEGFPVVLWEWLAIAPREGWALTPRQYMELKSRLFQVARVPHPANCIRHSFCTYHVAVSQNAHLTAFLLCHVNARKLWDTYKGNATKSEGEAYLNLRPETVEQASREWREILAARDRQPGGEP